MIAEIEEIVVVAADGTCLDTQSRVIKTADAGKALREKPRLNLLGNFDFLRRATFCLEPLGIGAPAGIEFAGRMVKACEGEDVSIGIDKASEGAATCRLLRRDGELHSSRRPFPVQGIDIFGKECDHRRVAHKAILVQSGDRQSESEDGSSVRRPDLNPATA